MARPKKKGLTCKFQEDYYIVEEWSLKLYIPSRSKKIRNGFREINRGVSLKFCQVSQINKRHTIKS